MTWCTLAVLVRNSLLIEAKNMNARLMISSFALYHNIINVIIIEVTSTSESYTLFSWKIVKIFNMYIRYTCTKIYKIVKNTSVKQHKI